MDMDSEIATKGHREHTQTADNTRGLPGVMPRPIKVTVIGAGSGFTPRLINDVLSIPGEQGGEIALVDIDMKRLKTMYAVIQHLVTQMGKDKTWTVQASVERREVLRQSDYVIICIEVSGLECVRFDNDIPAKYGVDQCIGDTIGPGGLFKGLRTLPVWLDILRDAEALCPNALVLNYTNPMNIMTLAAGRASTMQVAGLCHSVQGTSHMLAGRAEVPYDELVWECAGINHLSWFTTLEHQGHDLYPSLMAKARLDLAGTPANPDDAGDLIRKDMMLHFGAFITESSGHLSEYIPYYRKRLALLQHYAPIAYDGESGFYANGWPNWRKLADAERDQFNSGELPMNWERSWEYASWIIEGQQKNVPYRVHANVLNSQRGGGPLISNLMHDGCVEVACLIDRNGIQPTVYGRLPPQMAALCEANMRMFDLAVTAAIEHSKEAAIHALMLDPLTAAVCSPTEITQMAEELFTAEAAFLPGYQ